MTWGHQSGRQAPYPPDWKRRRRAVFARDNWTCVDCGWCDPSGGTLECDHLGQPDDHRTEMLATRCGARTPNNCHGARTAAASVAARTARARQRTRQPEQHPGLTQSGEDNHPQ